jgi:hypothetical protein
MNSGIVFLEDMAGITVDLEGYHCKIGMCEVSPKIPPGTVTAVEPHRTFAEEGLARG